MRSIRFTISLVLLASSVGLVGYGVVHGLDWRYLLPGAGLLILAVLALGWLAVSQKERLEDVELALLRSEVRAMALVEASPDGVVIVLGTKIIFANPAFRHLLAIPPDEEISQRDIGTLIGEEDRERVLAWIRERQDGLVEPDTLDFSGCRETGMEIALEAASALLPAAEGRQLAIFVRDVSARKALEERMRQVERVEALVDSADLLVSEFEKIFRKIFSITRHRKDNETEEERERMCEAIDGHAARGSALARRVLSLRPEGGEHYFIGINLARLVRKQAAEFMRGLGDDITLNLEVERDAPLMILGDKAQLRQAFWHVFENAKDAQGEGEVTLRVRRLELDDTAAATRPGSHPGTYGVVEIIDTGPGMSDEIRARAFEPFFSSKGVRSSGMGLTMAYGTIRAHHGFMEVDTEVGRGTSIRMALPLADTEEVESTGPQETGDESAAWRGRETILVVDDDPSSRQEARTLLERFGYHVEVASTPRAALQRLKQRPRIDLVLLDMVLPGWNGPDVLTRILRLWPGERVMMVSPYPLPDQEEHARKLGAVEIYQKPFTNPELSRAVRRALDSPPPAAP